MADITADNNTLIVDKEAGETKGTTSINYKKESYEELWERTNSEAWSKINVRVRTGLGDTADVAGTYSIVLKPGEVYEVGVYGETHSPMSNPILRVVLRVVCLWKKPEVRKFIMDQNRSTGGTWHSHQVVTSVSTNIVMIGATRDKPVFDATGIPLIKIFDGELITPLTFTNNHLVEIKPLFAGNHYFFIVVVADSFGNWEVWQEEFTTLRRKLTVEFTKMIIFNDGDPSTPGEAEFWFYVYFIGNGKPPYEVIQEFHLPTSDIDDWSETGRPYPLGFSHVGVFEVVQPEKAQVGTSSRAVEYDGIFELDEPVQSQEEYLLPLPAGQFVENVTNSVFTMDCRDPLPNDEYDFHYEVEVRWSVEYGA